MTPEEAHARLDELQLLDVREPPEWRAGHIAGAVHVPMSQLAARQDEIATDRTVVCVCRSGARSGRVAAALRQAGYDAENLDGGMQAWAAAELAFVSDDAGPARVV